ncbi:hypothetical protein MsAg5_13900 [Methanosarcinaceae archaeon Ag5]|uniref:Nuclear transport factor 2 family protein n=1 Tax=Methanolapillus africanus TaxID=3028297 RepID=A0AAE4SFN2_9EURY|nr:hypothetical protein [Methanosarcinaceae archaeon Ag5]
MTNEKIKAFFDRYAHFFEQSLDGKIDTNEISSLYAQEFIAASPLGVMAGKNDIQFEQTLAQGYEQYRKIGTKGMTVRGVSVSPIDKLHCVAHVAWTATYSTADNPNIAIDFEVHYLMQELDGKPQIFGWIAGDEQKMLKEYGII